MPVVLVNIFSTFCVGTASTTNDINWVVSEALNFYLFHPLIRINIQRYFKLLAQEELIDPSSSCSIPNESSSELPVLIIRWADIHSLTNPLNHCQRQASEGGVIAWSEEIIMGKFLAHRVKPSATVYEIQLCRGLQCDTLVSVLAHEMLHALLCLKSECVCVLANTEE